MKTLSEKLKSKSGVSAVFALIFFLAVSVVCVTMLTAAGTVLKRSGENDAMTENALALESAALLIRKELDEATVSRITVTDRWGSNPVVNLETTSGSMEPELLALEEVISGLDGNPSAGGISGEGALYEGTFIVRADELPDVRTSFELYRQSGLTDAFELVLTLKVPEREDTMFMDFLITCRSTTVEKDRNGQELTGDHLGVITVSRETKNICTCRFQRTENTKDGARGNR